MAEEDLPVPVVPDKDDRVEPGHHRARSLDGVRQRIPDDNAGDIRRPPEPRKIRLVQHGEDDGHAGPQFVAPAQRVLERAFADRHDDADRPVPVFFLEVPLQAFLIGGAAKAGQVEILAIDRDARIGVGVQYPAQPRPDS